MNPERIVERVLIASRWLLAPLYLGLALLLAVLAIHFYIELFHLALGIPSLREVDMILGALTLIDLALIGGLIVMVMLSGYENFVSKMDPTATEKQIAWLGKLDAGTLKLKVSASIVAISAIQLLKGYMDADDMANDKLMWMTIIHLTFVVSALLLTVMDRCLGAGHKA